VLSPIHAQNHVFDDWAVLSSLAVTAAEAIHDRAAAIDAALRIAENAGNRTWEAFWLIEAAEVHLAAGDTGEAMQCCRMAASLHRQIGDHSREATALDVTGEVLFAVGNAGDAAAFHLADCEQALGQADASREHLTAALALFQPFPDARAAALRTAIQEHLG
jgi:tetratricopeptide (TPR) repeat protein